MQSSTHQRAWRQWTGSHWNSCGHSLQSPSWPAEGQVETQPSLNQARSTLHRRLLLPDNSAAPALASTSLELQQTQQHHYVKQQQILPVIFYIQLLNTNDSMSMTISV